VGEIGYIVVLIGFILAGKLNYVGKIKAFNKKHVSTAINKNNSA